MENKEKNDAEIAELMFMNGESGQFGPFSRYVPLRKLDGTYKLATYYEWEQLKKAKKVVGRQYVVDP
ncbi:unnamed protein product [Heterosigma akashiwo]